MRVSGAKFLINTNENLVDLIETYVYTTNVLPLISSAFMGYFTKIFFLPKYDLANTFLPLQKLVIFQDD